MKTTKKHIAISSIYVLSLILACAVFTGFNVSESIHSKPKTHVVTIQQMKFDPAHITVQKGDIIKWINKDFVPHDVTESNKKWNSNVLNQDDTFSRTVTKSFEYFCSIHVVMKGSVSVKNH